MQRQTLTEDELKTIRESIEREFPHDPALQQVHIARKILSLEAKKAGMDILAYAALLRKSYGSESGKAGT